MICVNSVSVYPKSISLKVGTWSYAAYAEVCPSNADCKQVQWHSDNSSVASVNASSGYIYANGVGTTKIYATAIDGSGSSDYLTVTVSNSVPVSSVTLDRSSLSLEEGQSTSICATVCPDNATNKNVIWTSSNNNVATVSGGVVTAISKGSARITATAADGSGKSSFCVVTVTGDVLVTSITVSPKSQALTVGDSMFPGVIVCPSDATIKSVCWSSSNTNIATVNELTGLVIAQCVGNVTIYATACDGSGIVGCCSVKVNAPIMVECISVCPETLTMNVGETADLSANVCPANAKNKTIRWTPCDCNIADVDYVTGCVTAKAEGATYICAHAVDGSGTYGCCAVIVHTVPVSQIEVIPDTLTVNIGEKYYLNKTVSPNNATNQAVTWSSSDTSVATVSDEGEIIGIGEGNAIITVTSQDNGEIYNTCNVTVKIPVTAISVSPTSATINKDDTISLSAIISPSNATNKGVIWISSNTGVATVNDQGKVIGIGEGSAIITAASQDNGEIYSTCNVTVKIPVTAISVSPTSATINKDDTISLSAIISPSNATNKTVSWRSSNTGVATVNSNSGLVTAQGAGNATIYATAQDGSGEYGTCSIKVNAPVSVTSINVSPKQKTLSKNETTTLRATVCPCGASSSVIWTSSNTSVATVGTYTGVVTAKSDGATTITARSVNGNKTDTCTITVDSREKVTVKKDSHSFYVKFADGKVWKNIGIDLSKREENYNQMYPPNMWYENYEYLIEEEQRYFDNIYVEENGVIVNNSYSEKQIGFLYLLDPLGIEYYMRHNACQDMSLGATLFFKDRVYKEIFGVWPRLIKVFPDKTIQYYGYPSSISADTRADYYTDAEILFGEHPIYDILSLISFLLDVVPSVSLSLFSMFYPPVGVVLNGIELVKFLFFSASASGVLSSGTSSIMEEYTTNIYTLSGGESAGEKAGKAMGWVNFVLGTFSTILNAAEVFTPSINDITTYNRINASDYRVNYNVSGSELSMADIISRIS